MDLVKFKRDQEQYRDHVQRIRAMGPMLDSSTPESLGLKHLAVRPKKMQLMEDRRQEVAKENAKLMSLMTEIMNEKREQPRHERAISLNEPYRRRVVDKINNENERMMQRLKRVGPVISNSSFEVDFKKHLKAESHLRRRQMKPLAVPKDLYAAASSSSSSPNAALTGSASSTFNSSLYTAQKSSLPGSPSGLDMFDGMDSSPIRSVADFRKNVIATKKIARLAGMDMQQPQMATRSRPLSQQSDTLFELNHSS